MNILSGIYIVIRKVYRVVRDLIDTPITKLYLISNNVSFGVNLKSSGLPSLDIWQRGYMKIGVNFIMNNGKSHNRIGRQQPCIFVVANGAELYLGDNVGVSGVAIVCHNKIIIGNNVKIGGNVVVYDTDFHSLNFEHRKVVELDVINTKTKPVIIRDNVFIGAHSTILKGVTIGENSIIGAGSLVSRSIPANEIWGGNPIVFIKRNEVNI